MTNQNAAILIIGDEILKGRVQDSNSVYLTKQLFELGIKTERIVTVPDRVQVIGDSVRGLAKQFDHVITTGGVGPTHDDVTFSGIASGMERHLTTDTRLVEYLIGTGLDRTQARESRMAHIPTGAEVYFGDGNKLARWFPLVKVENVFILPGIPEYVKMVFEETKGLFKGARGQFLSSEIYFLCDESVFAKKLEEIQERWKDGVDIGSYPVTGQEYTTKLTIDSVNKDCLQNCCSEIETNLFPQFQFQLKSEQTKPEKLEKSKIYESNLLESFSVIQKVCVMYSYEEVCLAFNGGKDCTVLLEVFKKVLKQNNRDISKFLLLNIVTGEMFPELENFIQQISVSNKMEVVTLNGTIKEALTNFKQLYPNMKAILTGTRSIDPYSDTLHTFQTTDRDWPNYMRVMPILNWNYKHIWSFIWNESVQYCVLYDQGYTSLGDMRTTLKNPALRIVGTEEYKPAYWLEDEKLEREGRK